MESLLPRENAQGPSMSLVVAGVVNGTLAAGAALVMVTLTINLVVDPNWAWVALILWFGIGGALGVGYNARTPRPRWFWVLSALYNVAAFGVWVYVGGSINPVLGLVFALWIGFMIKLSVQEAWADRRSRGS